MKASFLLPALVLGFAITACLNTGCTSTRQSPQAPARIVQFGGTSVSISEKKSDGKTFIHVAAANAGSEDIYIPGYNLSPELTDNVLTVIEDGNTVPYTGVQIKRAEPAVEDCTLLKAGKTAEFDIDVQAYYPHSDVANTVIVTYTGPLGQSKPITIRY